MKSEPDITAVRNTIQRAEEASNRGRMLGLVKILDESGPHVALAEWRRRQNEAADEALCADSG